VGAVIPSILDADLGSAVMTAERAPHGGDPIELRADLLDAAEVQAIVGGDGRDWIVTVRRTEEGGFFEGSEDDRAALLRAALDAGARWVDVECDSALADWADGPMASRTILSHHGGRCTVDALRETYARLARSEADRIKLVPRPESAPEVLALREILREARDPRLCAFGLGRVGALSRLLALAWGSWGTYAAVSRGFETAQGQFTLDDLERVYDVGAMNADTGLVLLAGGAHILPGSPSPAMHNAGYREVGRNMRYLPMPCESWAEVETLIAGLAPVGLAVTMPFKADAARVGEPDDIVSRSGAANTLRFESGRVLASNTDGPAALGCLGLSGLLSGDTVDVIGGGGTGRAIAAALAGAGFRPTLWRREPRAGEPAPAGVEEGVLAARKAGESDWLVNATPRRDGAPFGDAVPARKGVLDAVYGRERTALIRRAEAAGLRVTDGFELLVAQAELQFCLQTGVEAPESLFAERGQRYLAGLG
jgi:3-dehydroquinate dehydratase type I